MKKINVLFICVLYAPYPKDNYFWQDFAQGVLRFL